MKKLLSGIKDLFGVTWWMFLLITFIYLGVRYDIYRWHTFQQLTHSDISYWKWHLLFGGKK